jgi:hypothetical protein
MDNPTDRIEIITRVQPGWRWTPSEKAWMVEETFEPFLYPRDRNSHLYCLAVVLARGQDLAILSWDEYAARRPSGAEVDLGPDSVASDHPRVS